MKLEKISENQIRCILTSEDLANREIKLGELAYGSDKARRLFHDMMVEARKQFGFSADNIPLMIEAIPGNRGSITLVITKVEDPEELDTRFSKFAPPHGGAKEEAETIRIENADDILNIIRKLYEAKQKAATPSETAEEATAPVQKATTLDYVQLFSFRTIDLLMDAAAGLGKSYQGENTVYKTSGDMPYTLILHKGAHTPEEFNSFCNILSEYGTSTPCTPAKEAHLREHAKIVLKGNALGDLRALR